MAKRRPRVLIVAWDGVRDDERLAASTPNLDALAARGFLVRVPVHAKNPTISGPVWTTLATGVHSDAHGVVDNDFRPNRLDLFPDVLSRIRAEIPGASTFAAGEWAPLFTATDGGPLFPGCGYRPPLGTDETVPLDVIAAQDEATTGRCAMELLARDHVAVFAYLVLPDMVGHTEGVTARYRAAVETCDEQLGVLLAAVAARPTFGVEDWTVIVATDHGHRDEGGHGGDSWQERHAWLAAAGPGIDASSGDGVDHADVAAHVLHALGIALPTGIAGRPFAAGPAR